MQDDIITIATMLTEYDTVCGSATGFFPIKPKQYFLFEHLLSVAQEEDLIGLTQDLHPVVRCYAFWALIKTGSKQAKKVRRRHSKDHESVKEQMFGCIVRTTTVARFMKDL